MSRRHMVAPRDLVNASNPGPMSGACSDATASIGDAARVYGLGVGRAAVPCAPV
jgi:hypothetical protein